MTCEERVEALLNRADHSLNDLPKDLVLGHQGEQAVQYFRKALQACDFKPDAADTISIGEGLVAACCYGLHLSEVIEELATTLEETLNRYDRAKFRLRSWGDVKYVADLEREKV